MLSRLTEAGVAAAESIKSGRSTSQVDIKQLQAELLKQEVRLF
jgi:hypothetical protein